VNDGTDIFDLLDDDYQPKTETQVINEQNDETVTDPVSGATFLKDDLVNDEIPEVDAEVHNKLLTLEQVKELLAYTEPVQTKTVTMDGTTDGIIVFSLPAGWNIGLKDKDGLELTEAEVAIGGNSYTLSKDAILDFTKAIGLTDAYVFKTPGVMIQTHLNYWASHSPDLQIKMLLHEETVLSTTKNGITPLSNLTLLDVLVEELEGAGYAKDDLLFDWKTHHDLNITSLRVLVTLPDEVAGQAWINGIELRNSLTGAKPLSVRGLLFNGSTGASALTFHGAGKYNRKIMGQDMDTVIEWLRLAVKNVIEVFDHENEVLANTAVLDLGSTSKVLADVFRTYKVPLKVRKDIIEKFENHEYDETYYGVVNAVADSANKDGLPEHFITTVMEIAGDIMRNASNHCESCKQTLI
jgi:hypothetical protein